MVMMLTASHLALPLLLHVILFFLLVLVLLLLLQVLFVLLHMRRSLVLHGGCSGGPEGARACVCAPAGRAGGAIRTFLLGRWGCWAEFQSRKLIVVARFCGGREVGGVGLKGERGKEELC
jgi:hypothetical protein